MIGAAPSPALRPPGVGTALRRAVRDLYEESLRLVTLNAVLGVYVVLVLALAVAFPPALVLLLGAGPLLAGLVGAAVIVVDTGSVSIAEAREALRRCWRRGLVLGLAVAAAAGVSVVAFVFYGGAGTLAWPLAVLVLYLGGMVGLYQLVLWPIALRDCERPLGEAARQAGAVLAARPVATLLLGLALLAVNLAGLVLGVLPFLTLTLAYSALAAARFALPPTPIEEG